MGVIIIFSLIIIAVISLIVVISCLKEAGSAEQIASKLIATSVAF